MLVINNYGEVLEENPGQTFFYQLTEGNFIKTMFGLFC